MTKRARFSGGKEQRSPKNERSVVHCDVFNVDKIDAGVKCTLCLLLARHNDFLVRNLNRFHFSEQNQCSN